MFFGLWALKRYNFWLKIVKSIFFAFQASLSNHSVAYCAFHDREKNIEFRKMTPPKIELLWLCNFIYHCSTQIEWILFAFFEHQKAVNKAVDICLWKAILDNLISPKMIVLAKIWDIALVIHLCSLVSNEKNGETIALLSKNAQYFDIYSFLAVKRGQFS